MYAQFVYLLLYYKSSIYENPIEKVNTKIVPNKYVLIYSNCDRKNKHITQISTPAVGEKGTITNIYLNHIISSHF